MPTPVPTVAPPLPKVKTPAELARERAAAAERAAKLAAAGQRARVSWETRGRPNWLIIVRTASIDIVVGGSLTGQVPRPVGVLTPAALARYVPNKWLVIADGTARLDAALVLTPGTVFDVGGDVKNLELVGGPTAPEAASIYTGSGRLRLTGVTVTSSDNKARQPMPPSVGRPFIVVSRGGTLDVTDSTISNLGRPPADPVSQAGVQFNVGSGGSVVRTTMLRNSVGLTLAGAQGVRLETVTLAESASDGLVLDGDSGTTLTDIHAERNGGNGVLVTGPSTDRPINGITTAGNGAYGVAIVGQTAPRISGIVTAGDKAGGLRLNSSTDVAVSDVATTDEPIGVYAHVGSGRIVLDKVRITGGRRGVVLDKTTTGVQMTATTIDAATVVGVAIGGKEIDMRDLAVNDSRTAVRVERGADGITATGLRISGGEDGFVATAGSTRVVLKDIVVDSVDNDGVRTASANTTITGGTISGGATGIDVAAATTISGTSINFSNQGIHSESADLVHADHVDVAAIAVGINVEPGRSIVLSDSRVKALEAVRGEVVLKGNNDLSLPPLNLLAAIGVPLVLLAFVLEQVHAFRQRGTGRKRRQLPRALPAGTG